ncbi:MAG: TylF/MycF/NovP-related O-methyltransferase [Flavobacterium sp.]|nr:TylF/MycF/NovP-related O-methyltransferase [Flavobacterium sp.]
MKLVKKIILYLNKHILLKLNLIICRPLLFSHSSNLFDVYCKLDYVRVMTLNLICQQLIEKKVEGNIAELGVYQGSFSSLMSQCLPNKSIYLYDTFQGFDASLFNTKFEKEILSSKLNDFNNTSLNLVLEKMPYKDKCVVREGLFPKTIQPEDNNETFCLVSLDCDLHDPIYDGLTFFYPRLNRGGYILIHDYNDTLYRDCKLAVDKYCELNNISIIPIPDGWGSAIITK